MANLRMKKLLRNTSLKINVFRGLFVIAAVLLWQIMADYGIINVLLLSSPLGAGTHLWLILIGRSDVTDFYSSLYVTLIEITLAYAVIVTLGVPLGISLGLNRFLGMTFDPLIIAFFSIPNIVLYPIMFLIFGLGIASKIIYAVVVASFVVIQNSTAGTKQIRPEFVQLGASLGFTKPEMLRKILIPAALPSIVTGLKLGLGLTIIGVIAGEMIASTTGLGHLIIDSFSLLRINDLFAIIFVILAIATLANLALTYVENRVHSYRGIGNAIQQ